MSGFLNVLILAAGLTLTNTLATLCMFGHSSCRIVHDVSLLATRVRDQAIEKTDGIVAHGMRGVWHVPHAAVTAAQRSQNAALIARDSADTVPLVGESVRSFAQQTREGIGSGLHQARVFIVREVLVPCAMFVATAIAKLLSALISLL